MKNLMQKQSGNKKSRINDIIERKPTYKNDIIERKPTYLNDIIKKQPFQA